MIAKMRKLDLLALSYDRDAVLDALRRTDAVEIKEHAETAGTVPLAAEGEDLGGYLDSLEAALKLLTAAEAAKREHKEHPAPAPEVSYSEFLAYGEKKEEIDAFVSEVNALAERKNMCISERARLSRAAAQVKPYAQLPLPFSAYADTRHTKAKLGLLSPASWESVKRGLGEIPLAAFEEFRGEDAVVLFLAAHRSAFAEAEALLAGAGFAACPYTGDRTGAEMLSELEAEADDREREQAEAEDALASLVSGIPSLKIYCDYIAYRLEKAEAAGKMRATGRTFLLEAFVPAEAEEKVRAALGGMDVYYEFSDPAEDEFVPTLVKNNKLVENFETITNMYSVPSARELDPNTVMSVFYSIFIGFIMADVGYGLMMMLGGGFLYYRNRAQKGGIKPLAGVFAFSGIFTVIWGLLFNSLFGIKILPYTVMPDAQTAMWSLAGIDIPAVLVISLLIGIVQLMAGYLCKMAQCWHRGRYLDGVFEGGVWAVFSVGAGLAVMGLVEDLGMPYLAAAGGILAAVSLGVAVLTAGRHEKFLGKITKGFSSVYGLINYFTDVLSYIRLYGLMLTGAVIAQIISQYAVGFMTSGSFLVVVGVLLMVIGHVFNLAISLLGAYIHTARLQYVEFFGKFYEGDGELFTPLGSNRKYVNVL